MHLRAKVFEQPALQSFDVGSRGQMRTNDPETIGLLHSLKTRDVLIGEDGLFPEEDAPILRATGEEMLRALIHEVPAEMAEADEVRR